MEKNGLAIQHDDGNTLEVFELPGDQFTRSSLRQYMMEINSYPVLSADEERELAIAAKTDAGAKSRFIECNLRLVVKAAKKYYSNEMEFLDLVQEGNFGLMKAVDSYDPDMGYRFSTYAMFWIRQSISRSIMSNIGIMRTPTYVSEKIQKMDRVSNALAQSLGRDPLPEEVALEMGISVEELLNIGNKKQVVKSLDDEMSEDGESLVDIIEDESARAPESGAMMSVGGQQIADAMIKSGLSEREQNIIILRYGMADGVDLSFEDIGKKVHLSGERVRQIEKSAMKKLAAAAAM